MIVPDIYIFVDTLACVYCWRLLADEFNCVRFCAYRTAMKLRQVQRKLRRTITILAFLFVIPELIYLF